MKDFLDEIVAHKRVEVEQFKVALPERELHALVEKQIAESDERVSLRKALMSSDTGIIAEFKRKSPSKGWIKEEGKASEIPLSYQQNGATALSILTDTEYFGGYDEYITTARQAGVTLPILYKNFVIDEYQLFQAKHCVASAVLLIAACLPIKECKTLLYTAHQLGLEVLLEMHGEGELDYAELEPDVYGINNRNLGSFVTDVKNSFNMASHLPKDVCKISESGIDNPQIVRDLRFAGFTGFLMGEHFMRANNSGVALNEFIKSLKA